MMHFSLSIYFIRLSLRLFFGLSMWIYTTWTQICGHQNNGAICKIWTCHSRSRWLMCCFTSLHSSGFSLSTRFWNVAAGIWSHSATRALVRSKSDIGWYGLVFEFILRCWVGLRSELCAGLSSFSTSNWENRFFMDLTLCTKASSCWKRKRAFHSLPVVMAKTHQADNRRLGTLDMARKVHFPSLFDVFRTVSIFGTRRNIFFLPIQHVECGLWKALFQHVESVSVFVGERSLSLAVHFSKWVHEKKDGSDKKTNKVFFHN